MAKATTRKDFQPLAQALQPLWLRYYYDRPTRAEACATKGFYHSGRREHTGKAFARLGGSFHFADALFQRPRGEIGLLFINHQRRCNADCVFTGAE